MKESILEIRWLAERNASLCGVLRDIAGNDDPRSDSVSSITQLS